jgi:ATP-dependent DNA helicase RecQ
LAEGSGIVYCATIKQVELVTEWLQQAGLDVEPYHGRLRSAQRHDTQDRFMRGELKAIVATNAFGMGIDKADIRFVLHFGIPASLEAYYQESGRAGRDGEAADCVLLYQKNDRNTQRFFMGGRYPTFDDIVAVHDGLVALERADVALTLDARKDSFPGVSAGKARVVLALLRERRLLVEKPRRGPRLARALGEADFRALAQEYEDRRARDQRKLEQMVVFAQTARCRWAVLLDYFGELAVDTSCGHCDVCERRGDIHAVSTASVTEFAVGDSVLVATETGTVVGITGNSVDVKFTDGAVRMFARERLTVPA